MKKMYIVLAACACILLAGCGNVADSEETATVTTTVTTTTTAPEIVLPKPVATTAETTTTTAPEEPEPEETTTTTKKKAKKKTTTKAATTTTTTAETQAPAAPATEAPVYTTTSTTTTTTTTTTTSPPADNDTWNNGGGNSGNGNSGSGSTGTGNGNTGSGNSGSGNTGNNGGNSGSGNSGNSTDTGSDNDQTIIDIGIDSSGEDAKSKADYVAIGKKLSNDGSDLSKAKAVWKYMLTTYKSEHPGVNCISYSSACYAVCNGIGLKCRYLQLEDSWYNHVATAVYVDDAWYVMDTQGASKSSDSNISNFVDLFNDMYGFKVMQDEYGNKYDVSCISKTKYFEYCEMINGYCCIYELTEKEAVTYHQSGVLPQHVLDDIEFDKQTL